MPRPPVTHPPLPRLAFRVGVVGHRWNRLPRDAAPMVQAAIATVLREVRAAAVGAQGPWYASGEPDLRVVSSLAEGADRIAVKAALDDLPEAGQPAFHLDLVLPFAETAFRASFDHPEELGEFDRLSALASRTLVLDGRPERFDAFVAGGRAVVDQCDLLIAVWDMDAAEGAGGTTNQVAYALREEVPVVLVDPARPSEPWLLDDALPDRGAAQGIRDLAARVRAQLMPPEGPDLRQHYFEERHVRGHLGKVFRVVVAANQRGAIPILGWPRALWQLLRGLFRPDFPVAYPEAARTEWLTRWADPLTIGPGDQDQLVREFAAPFGWADRLASYYANRYRSAFATVFSLSWVTVLLAVVGSQLHEARPWSLILAGIETGMLLTIYLVVARGRSGRHHKRWLDYRALAERLRHLTFLWPLGRASFLARMPRHAGEGDPRVDWTAWLVRATVRAAGMPTGTITKTALAAERAFLRAHELEVQARYHEATSARLGAVQHRMHPQVELAFAGALIGALAHLLALLPWTAVGLPEWHYPVLVVTGLTILTIVLPAFGASRHGFLGQGDLLGSSMRSATLALQLRDLQRRLDRLGGTEDLESLLLGDLALEAARTMEADLTSWRVLFQGKPLGLA